MQLNAWRSEHRLTLAQLARRLNVGVATAHGYCQQPGHPQHRVPHPRTMRRIYQATGGAVTPNDFYDLPELAAA